MKGGCILQMRFIFESVGVCNSKSWIMACLWFKSMYATACEQSDQWKQSIWTWVYRQVLYWLADKQPTFDHTTNQLSWEKKTCQNVHRFAVEKSHVSEIL